MRLARRSTPLTTGAMERFLRACGVSVAAYKLWTGFRSLREDVMANPGWTLRRWQELVIENLDILQNVSKSRFEASHRAKNGAPRGSEGE